MQSSGTRVLIRPALLRELKHVRAVCDSAQGRIECAWRVAGKRVVVEVAIPAGARATVQLPARSAEAVRESGKSLAASKGVDIAAVKAGWVTLRIVSGRYRFSLPQPKQA